MSQFVAEVSDSNWETEVMQSDRPVLVDFWAAWCGPCRMLAPTVEQVAEKYQGKAKVVKLNVDENIEISGRYGIRGIPTLVLLTGGRRLIVTWRCRQTPLGSISQMIEKQLA